MNELFIRWFDYLIERGDTGERCAQACSSFHTKNKTKMSSNEAQKYFRNQKFSKISGNCIKKEKKFKDPQFLPEVAVRDKKFAGVEWKRPTEISSRPRLVSERLNGSSVTQGQLGNCWFVAACCSLAQEKDLWKTVVPHHEAQDYDPDKFHSGALEFRIWRFGRWMSVVIDDRLPTRHGSLVFAHSIHPDEFWCSLLEKAYAKLFGSYEALDGGNLIDALVDFTGGYGERLDLEEEGVRTDDRKRGALFERLREQKKHHTLMCCALGVGSAAEERESQTPLGLVKGHAYCITDVRCVDIKRTGLFAVFKGSKEKLNMIRLRNPWGEVEWKGPFSDTSDEWKKITKHDREKCGLTFDEDGEFWMTFDDFCRNFSSASACHLVNTSWFSFSQTWNEAQFYGAWSVGAETTPTDRSGGCSNHPNTFLRNPQFCLEVRADKDELMVMLQQGEGRDEEAPPSKSKKKTTSTSVVGKKRKPNSIGFHLYKVELNRKYRVHSVWETSAGSCTYMASRNVFKSLELAKGRYLLLPTTFEPGQTGQFVLRMFTKTNVHFRELTTECPKQPLLHIFSKYRSVSNVLVQEGHNISTGSEAAHLYFVLSSEGEKVKGHVKNEGASPKWNQAAIFYHKSTAPKIKIQVYNKKAIHDDLVGEGTLDIPAKTEDNKKSVVRVKLNLKHDKSNNHLSEVYVILNKSKNLKQF